MRAGTPVLRVGWEGGGVDAVAQHCEGEGDDDGKGPDLGLR